MADTPAGWPYRISEKIIGRGSSSVVYLAHHAETREPVAVKIIRSGSRFYSPPMEECKILQTLHHPRVIPLLGHRLTEGKFYLCFPYVQGETLGVHLSRHKVLTEPQARAVFRQITQGLAYCHSRDVIHRDLKLDNIMIDSQGQALLIDFGFAILHPEAAPPLRDHPGTPFYSAPELVRGIPYRGKPADVWALGVILFALVHGVLPFVPDTIEEMYSLIVWRQPSVDPGLSPSLRELLTYVLHKKVELRFDIEEVSQAPWMGEAGPEEEKSGE